MDAVLEAVSLSECSSLSLPASPHPHPPHRALGPPRRVQCADGPPTWRATVPPLHRFGSSAPAPAAAFPCPPRSILYPALMRATYISNLPSRLCASRRCYFGRATLLAPEMSILCAAILALPPLFPAGPALNTSYTPHETNGCGCGTGRPACVLLSAVCLSALPVCSACLLAVGLVCSGAASEAEHGSPDRVASCPESRRISVDLQCYTTR